MVNPWFSLMADRTIRKFLRAVPPQRASLWRITLLTGTFFAAVLWSLQRFQVVETGDWITQRDVIVLGTSLAILSLVVTVLTRVTRRSNRLSILVRSQREKMAGLRRPKVWVRDTLRRLKISIAVPSLGSLWLAFGVALMILVIQYVFASRFPAQSLPAAYSTLWQVQLTVGVVALPILIFVIELAKDDRAIAQRAAEVLIRHTFVFPIIALVLIGSLTLGAGARWLISSRSYLIGYVIFVLTVVLVIFAYGRALLLLFDTDRLKEQSVRLLKERFEASIDQTVELRIGANILLQKARELGIVYSQLGPGARDDRFVVLESPTSGYVLDVDLSLLEQFVRLLPWASQQMSQQSGEDQDLPESDPDPGLVETQPPAIQLLRVYGDRVYPLDRGLLALAKAHFGPIDRATLERRLSSVFEVGEQT